MIRAFPTTHWSEVARAAGNDPWAKREALEVMLRRYLPAFRAHLSWRGVAEYEVDDLVQGFVCDRVVAEELIAGADRTRGKFRTYMLTALDRHVARVHRSASACRRRPAARVVGLGAAGNVPAPDPGAAETFNLAWARQVVAQAIGQMRKSCHEGRRLQVWQVFEACALVPLFDGAAPPSPQEAMDRFGLDSSQQVSNTLVTGKRMFARVLRAVVGEYACDEGEIDDELKELWATLARAGTGRR